MPRTFRTSYPEMTNHFVKSYDPKKESVLDYVSRNYRSHERFLKKRQWSQDKIRELWHGIINSLVNKREKVRKMEWKNRLVKRRGHWKVVDRY